MYDVTFDLLEWYSSAQHEILHDVQNSSVCSTHPFLWSIFRNHKHVVTVLTTNYINKAIDGFPAFWNPKNQHWYNLSNNTTCTCLRKRVHAHLHLFNTACYTNYKEMTKYQNWEHISTISVKKIIYKCYRKKRTHKTITHLCLIGTYRFLLIIIAFALW